MNELNQTKTPRTDALDNLRFETRKLFELSRELERDLTELRAKAQAVVDRWESPRWKEAGPTAAVMNELRNELTKGDK